MNTKLIITLSLGVATVNLLSADNINTQNTTNLIDKSKLYLEGKKEESIKAYNNDELIRGFVDYKYTTIYINPTEKQTTDTGDGVEVAKTQTNSINIISAGIILLPNTNHISLSYSKSFSGDAQENSMANKKNEGVEQFNIEFKLWDKIELAYEKYKLNAYIKVNDGEKVLMVDPTNTTAKSGNLSDNDTGVNVLNGGDYATFSVIKDRFDMKYYAEDKNLFDAKLYTGMYYEKFQKPWSSSFEVWSDLATDTKIAVVYTESMFTSYGISTGFKQDFQELKNGFNLKSLNASLGLLDIGLTDNYSLSDKMAEHSKQQGYKINLASEIAYKKSFSKRIYGVMTAFANYDYHIIDLGHTTTSYSPTGTYGNHMKGGSVNLSNDITYGLTARIVF